MSFLAQNWPFLLFVGVMIYMHLFMHRSHGRHRHHDNTANPTPSGDGSGGQTSESVPEQSRPHRHGGC